MSQALYPSYSDIDTYRMAACSIDTAIRNAVSAGGSLESLALLDNFCWCDSNNPERLGELKDAAKACFYYAIAYGTPFISGKDSMFNDFHGYDKDFNEVKISIPPTLLISSIGVVEDVRRCQTIDFKFPGDLLYCVGMTKPEMGGSEYLAMMGERLSGSRYIGNRAPSVQADNTIVLYRAVEEAMKRGYIASSISIERGGLGVALGKSAMAGMKGCSIDLSKIPAGEPLRDDDLLFSESQGRFLFSVNPQNKDEFELLFDGMPLALIGTVSHTGMIEVIGMEGRMVISTDVDALQNSYKSTFKDFQG
jgi:phosphoribosylformylglycinamidine synthase